MDKFNYSDAVAWFAEGAAYGALVSLFIGILFHLAYLRFMVKRVSDMRKQVESKTLAEIMGEGEER